MKTANDNPHPELQTWLKIALSHGWPEDAKPYIDGQALRIPEIRVRSDGTRLSVEWLTVTSREKLLKALGYGPVFD